ncbi:MAG: DUF6516 family protein [Thiobacillus sp.]|jgi:hypothetical protein|uniref:toxin-antitoxin system TumE family protein n=1 Tax=Thiobacillus sp. TaxID=924 RepID=UPI002894BC3B|nr:DUF6516 family protein [Thiobacillus sp.]MDT3706434.1 DUF6516 family protein [Thiobacillus sp.]
MSLHLELGSAIEAAFGDDLDFPVEQKQDALIIRLKNGVTLNVCYAAPDAYSLRWVYGDGDVELGIDTAPLHPGLSTFPNHFHDLDGHVAADPITRSGALPQENLQKLVRALLDDPLLGAGNIPDATAN